jgi:hypothetical protein
LAGSSKSAAAVLFMKAPQDSVLHEQWGVCRESPRGAIDACDTATGS